MKPSNLSLPLWILLTLIFSCRSAEVGTQYFRIAGPVSASITALSPDGNLTWTNVPAEGVFTVQSASSLVGKTHWVDFVQFPATNHTATLKVFELNLPAGMALIPAGAFTMGDTIDGNVNFDATPIRVNVSAFYMDVNLVSWSLWKSVYYWAKTNGYADLAPGAGKAEDHPVQTVSWYDCVKWCNARSEQAGKPPVYFHDAAMTVVYRTGETFPVYANWSTKGYRLPTEAEWEKAARGGLSGQRFPWGNTISENQANYAPGPGQIWDLGGPQIYATTPLPYTSPVGSFAPNGYGLYDMAGNVWEWCWDANSGYAGGTDPHGPNIDHLRAIRGGGWPSDETLCRSARRYQGTPVNRFNFLGFRSALPHGQP